MGSVAQIREAEQAGASEVEKTAIVVNGLVTWSDSGVPVDTEKKDYLGQGQLLEEPDTLGGA